MHCVGVVVCWLLHILSLCADGWDAAPAPAPQQAQFASADQFGAQY